MEQLLVALDVDSVAEARGMADRLRGVVGGFKVGSRLFTGNGPSLVEELASRGDRVFLDLKFHDIPNTVAGAVAAATRLGVWMVNVHASGGRAMMRAARAARGEEAGALPRPGAGVRARMRAPRAAADEEAARLSRPAPLLIAVTMLTSLDQESVKEIGLVSLSDQVERLPGLTQAARAQR